MLKTLEEPPQNTVLILITHNLKLIPQTIKSRCIKIKFNPCKLLFNNFKNEKDRENIIISDGYPNIYNLLLTKDGDLIKKNSVLGRLQFEQSDAGAIVQGLPKIDELLEAREPVEKRFSGIHFQLACYWRKYLRVYGPTQGCTRSFEQLRALIVNEIKDVYQSQGVYNAD